MIRLKKIIRKQATDLIRYSDFCRNIPVKIPIPRQRFEKALTIPSGWCDIASSYPGWVEDQFDNVPPECG